MDPSPTAHEVDEARVEALIADAVAGRPLSAAAEDSLARGLEKLPEAVAASDAEARARR